MFKLGRISPPEHEWTNRTRGGEWEMVYNSDVEVWIAMIDHDGPIETFGDWTGMIEVRADTEEMVVFLAEQIVDRLNDPRTHFVRRLKVGA